MFFLSVVGKAVLPRDLSLMPIGLFPQLEANEL